MKKIPIGIENFKELIDKNYYYVDKSMFIKDVLDENVAIYIRPRRFGKTLNMSMLYYFLSNKEKDNAYLFDNLEISKYSEVMKHQNQYPVIFITLKDMKRDCLETQIDKFKAIISVVIDNHDELLTSSALNSTEKKLMLAYLNKEASKSDLIDALYNISQCLKKHYHQNVIVLIDEYDVPLQTSYLNDYYDELVMFLKNVFSAVLKTNNNLEKGILTGCLRIAKESIFTDLNNFKPYSILTEKSSSYFGFTQDEVDRILKDYGYENYHHNFKEWYDGYLFGRREIYNPWSVLMYADKLMTSVDHDPESFWANTSGNDIVVNYIENADNKMRKEFEQLMQGKVITKRIKQELTYKEIDNPDNIYSFLLLTGYLKIKQKVDFNTYELVIPNQEVHQIYEQSFIDYFDAFTKHRKNDFYQALLDEKIETAQNLLNEILNKSISYYDNQENFYHGFLVGLLTDLRVDSNKESGDGRFDIEILPEVITGKAIIIECKHSKDEDNLIKDSQEGAKQIVNKRYFSKVKYQRYPKVVGYGISFHKKQCYITKAQ